MRVITEEPLKNYISRYPDTETALQAWLKTVKKANWTCFAAVSYTHLTLPTILLV